MELRQLKHFLVVADVGSFSRAAERLHIAQPALSRQIRLLEESLGVSLFLRHGRGVALTAAGVLLKSRAAPLLKMAESVTQEVTATLGAVTGRVVFGLIPSIAPFIAGAIVQRFRAICPLVELEIQEAMSGTLQSLLARKEIDVAITYAPYSRRNLRVTPLLVEQLCLVGAANSAFAGAGEVTLAAALEKSLILPGLDHGLRRIVESAAAESRLNLEVDIEVNHLPLQIDLVLQGIAHTVLPLATVLSWVRRGELVACPIVKPYLSRTLVLAVSADQPTSVASVRLCELLTQEIQDKIETGGWPGAGLS